MWNFPYYGSKAAFIEENGSRITYDELVDIQEDFKRHIKEKCLVVILCSNTIGSVIGYTSSINNGVVTLLLDKKINYKLFVELLQHYQPLYIWLPTDYLEIKDYTVTSVNKYTYNLLKRNKPSNYELNKELALLLTTSGTTGSSKLVMLSYQNIVSNAESIVKYLKLNKRERPITTLPMNYSYGLSIINSHLLVGATILLTNKGVYQQEFWNYFKKYRATSFGGVPAVYELLSKLGFTQFDLPSLKIMTQAGGKLSNSLQEKFAEYAEENGIKFYIMYGQTEATARISYLPPERVKDKIGSIGLAIPGGTMSLVNSNNQVINDSFIEGELVFKGNNVMLGYARKIEDLSLEDLNKGILYTGDIAQKDDDGYYYIVGRKKRYIKICGNRISLDEIEIHIKNKFPNEECACTGKEDELWIYLTSNKNKQDIIKYLVDELLVYDKAIYVRIINSIPTNTNGKIEYKNLK